MDKTKYATSYHNNTQKGSLDQIVAAYLESVYGTEKNMKLLRSNTPYVYNKKNQVKLFHHFSAHTLYKPGVGWLNQVCKRGPRIKKCTEIHIHQSCANSNLSNSDVISWAAGNVKTYETKVTRLILPLEKNLSTQIHKSNDIQG